MNSEPPPASDQFVQSLARGLSVITTFDADHPEMTLSEVASRAALSRATARRFLHTLVELGFVRTDGRRFALTPQVLSLGTSYLSSFGLPQIAQPHLEQLSGEQHESTSVAVLDGHDIVYVARIATRRIMSVGISVGTRFPAYATSMGRVLLAGLSDADLQTYLSSADFRPLTHRTLHTHEALSAEIERVRDQGWSFVDQELEHGLRSLAAPIVRLDGAVVAAVNLSASTTFDEPADLVSAGLPSLHRTAAAIGADLAAAGGRA